MNTGRRNARGEATLQRILDATITLVGRYGYGNTTIARVVKATQRPASSIYWYFDSKDELITAALESSYSTTPEAHQAWGNFDPARPVLQQLVAELEPELRASESETPLRLGIMVALEGSSAASPVRQPFRRRRTKARGLITSWWADCFRSNSTVRQEEAVTYAEWMTQATISFLDAHYVSDVQVDDDAATYRSHVLARVLTGAFEHLATNPVNLTSRSQERTPIVHIQESAKPTEQSLLKATRKLVAELGYEGATVGRICDISGVQRSSLYWRYSDKDALIKAAVADPFLNLFAPLQSLNKQSADQPDWQGALIEAVAKSMHYIVAQPETVKAGLLLKVQRWDPPTSGATAITNGINELERHLAIWFSSVLPPERSTHPLGEHLAWAMCRLLEGFMLGAALGRRLDPRVMELLLPHMLDRVISEWALKQ